MSKKSAPPPPDPQATIAAQSQANTQNLVQNEEANRINQYGPSGSTTYQISGYNQDGTPQYAQTTSLSPALQNIYDLSLQGGTGLVNTALGMEGQVGNSYAQPINTSGLPGLASGAGNTPSIDYNSGSMGPLQYGIDTAGQPSLQSGIQNPGLGVATSAGNAGPVNGNIRNPGIPLALGASAAGGPSITGQVGNGQANWQPAIQQAQNAAYGAQTQYLDPRFAQEQEALQNQLANEGVDPNSAAYQTAMQNFGLEKQRAYQSAQDAAVQAGNQEQGVLYGQALSNAELQNAANAQAFGQGATNAGILNAAQGQAFGESAQQQQAQAAAQAQRFQEGATNAGILNSAQAQLFGQNAQQADIANQAYQAFYQQALQSGQFANESEAQAFAQQQAQQYAQNQAQQQQYNEQYQNAQLQNQANQEGLQNIFALRNQPLNEFESLINGGQVQQPGISLPGVAGASTQPVQAANIMQNAYNQQLQQYQANLAPINNLFSLGGSLGSAALLGGF